MNSTFFILVVSATLVSVLGQTPTKLQNDRYLGNLNASAFMKPWGGTLRIGAAISMDSGDQYAAVAAQQYNGWEIFVNYVNLQRSPPGIQYNGTFYDLELLQIEDYSDSDYVTYATEQMLDGNALWNGLTPDFYFAPYGSALTSAMLTLTEEAQKTLFAATSSSTAVWTSSIQYGFTSLYASNTWYNPGLNYYYSAGARTATFICNSGATGNTCNFGGSSQTDITNTFADSNIELKYYYEMDPFSSTYSSDLSNAVTQTANADIDIVVIMDYNSICIDFPPQAQVLDWTPNAMMLVFCANNADVVSSMGTDVYYSTTYTAWSPQSTYTSGITGTSNADFVASYEEMFDNAPLYQSAEGYACGEILLEAIEKTNSIDPTTIANYIVQNSFSTILSANAISFPERHQAVGDWLSLQFDTNSNTYIVADQPSNLVYPMPTWASRSAVTTLPPTSSSGCTSDNNDDSYTKQQTGAFVITAVFCWIGGILTALCLLILVPEYTGYGVSSTTKKPMASKESEMTDVSSSSA